MGVVGERVEVQDEPGVLLVVAAVNPLLGPRVDHHIGGHGIERRGIREHSLETTDGLGPRGDTTVTGGESRSEERVVIKERHLRFMHVYGIQRD